MRSLIRINAVIVLIACMGGCATEPPIAPSATVTSVRKRMIAPDRARSAVAIGKSTRADVAAALGETLVISFDTGYEVWVYRLGNTKTGEFVILFAPSGIVAKTRIRAPDESR